MLRVDGILKKQRHFPAMQCWCSATAVEHPLRPMQSLPRGCAWRPGLALVPVQTAAEQWLESGSVAAIPGVVGIWSSSVMPARASAVGTLIASSSGTALPRRFLQKSMNNSTALASTAG